MNECGWRYGALDIGKPRVEGEHVDERRQGVTKHLAAQPGQLAEDHRLVAYLEHLFCTVAKAGFSIQRRGQ